MYHVGMAARLAVACTLVFPMLVSTARADLLPGLNGDLVLVHDGRERFYDVYVPGSYDGSMPVPLVVDMHGLTRTKEFQRLVSGWDDVAETEGFLVVYPQGLSSNWSDSCCEGVNADTLGDIDDVGFLRSLVAEIASTANIDPNRVYATGRSDGGNMTVTLACEAADLFAAFVPTAVRWWFAPPFNCSPSRPVAVLSFHSTNDLVVPYSGTDQFPSAPDVLTFWRDTNQCVGDQPDQVTVLGPDSMCEVYTQCADGVESGLCTVKGTELMTRIRPRPASRRRRPASPWTSRPTPRRRSRCSSTAPAMSRSIPPATASSCASRTRAA